MKHLRPGERITHPDTTHGTAIYATPLTPKTTPTDRHMWQSHGVSGKSHPSCFRRFFRKVKITSHGNQCEWQSTTKQASALQGLPRSEVGVQVPPANGFSPIGSRYLRMVLEVKVLPENGLWDQRHPQDGPGPLSKAFIYCTKPPLPPSTENGSPTNGLSLDYPTVILLKSTLCSYVALCRGEDILQSKAVHLVDI